MSCLISLAILVILRILYLQIKYRKRKEPIPEPVVVKVPEEPKPTLYKIETDLKQVNVGKVIVEFLTKSNETYTKEYNGSINEYITYADLARGTSYHKNIGIEMRHNIFYNYHNCSVYPDEILSEINRDQRYIFQPKIDLKEYLGDTFLNMQIEIPAQEIVKITAKQYNNFVTAKQSRLVKLNEKK